MEDIFEEIVKIRAEGGEAALATITAIKGSTPRSEGSKMLIRSDGSTVGSVGGGIAEAQVCKEAMEVIKECKTRMLHFNLTEKKGAEEGMICGGNMDILIEPVMTSPNLYVFGGGHISFSISKIGKMLGFKVTIIDDRPEFANSDRFPEADEIIAQDLKEVFLKINVNKSSYIVIVTRGHLQDELVLEWAVKTEAKYIGMIGSKKKFTLTKKHLEDKFKLKEIKRIHCPIGLDINAQTPEEIAVSIISEIIKVKNENI